LGFLLDLLKALCLFIDVKETPLEPQSVCKALYIQLLNRIVQLSYSFPDSTPVAAKEKGMLAPGSPASIDSVKLCVRKNFLCFALIPEILRRL
jgi:hypothetical protein